MDHASSMVQVFRQTSLGTSDTVRSKDAYKTLSNDMGINAKYHRGSNRFFKSKGFKEKSTKRYQHLSLSGVGAHSQN